MSETMNVTEAKARLSELVASVAATQEHIEITRNGELAAVLISHEELEALRETVAVLSDPQTAADIAGGLADIRAGRTIDVEDLCSAMASRRSAAA